MEFLKVYNDDILKFDIEKLKIKDSIIFGNLPYNISSQILIKILNFKKWPPDFNDLIFMFQKELGDKIIGKYPSSNYGRLSIITSYRLEVIKKFLVSQNCFFPKPKVKSMVIQLKPRLNKEFIIKKIKNLEKITNIFFSNKRKMINKNVKKVLDENQINMVSQLNLKMRPAEIKPDIYYKITELIEKN
jgi:16S rRNA (adenine1518-N6/adenine1519-N6)-dimethyltransferase